MSIPLINRLGDCNPQLSRELKGRLNRRNVALALAISLLGQTLLLASLYGRWLDIFVWLSCIGIFVLLVVGAFMLVSDIIEEEHCRTLDFIRLSPQLSQTILLGKILGVPVLVYLAGILAIPLHLWAGLAAGIPLTQLLTFYAILVASCWFFYSAAELFGLVSAGLSGFEAAWLCVCLVLLFLLDPYSPILSDGTGWRDMFSPLVGLAYFINPQEQNNFYWENLVLQQLENLRNLKWFYLPVGANIFSWASLALLNYGFWSYWIWQALNRQFIHPGASLLTKRQSYWLAAGFGIWRFGTGFKFNFYEYGDLLFWFASASLNNVLFFLFLIYALSPNRQACQGWLKSLKRQILSNSQPVKSFSNRLRLDYNGYSWRHWIWSESSPSTVAIALNLMITAPCIVPWILSWPDKYFAGEKIASLLSIPLEMNLILAYAIAGQMMRLNRSRYRVIGFLSVPAAVTLWFVSVILYLFILMSNSVPVQLTDGIMIMFFAGFVAEILILGVLLWQLIRQLEKLGASAES